jgi:phosphoglycolate phosphatase-like HAD superfamily hydrolase
MFKIKPNLEAIIWDFDGVILDSNLVRDQGFYEVLKAYKSEDVEELLKFHQANGGLSRYVKFKHFYGEILKVDYSDSDIQSLARSFSEIMKKLLTNKALLIKETLAFISANFEDTPMHIVSGSDGEELRFLCDELCITQFFKSIDGSPIPKTENVRVLIQSFKYESKNMVLVGDSINDFDATVDNNLQFFAYNNDEILHLTNY